MCVQKSFKRKLLSYKDDIVDQAKPIVPYLRKKRILVLVGGSCCYNLRIFDALKEERKLKVTHSKPSFHRHLSR